MRYRDDIDPDRTWVVSDTHFGHDNIVGFCHRPEDHEQVMIAEWRKEIPDDATVLHLGDLAYKGNARFKHIVAKELTGADKKIVLGNHDRQRFSFYKSCGFQIVRPFAIPVSPIGSDIYVPTIDTFTDAAGKEQQLPSQAKWEVSFSHYPWNEDEDGPMPDNALRIHGHIHNSGYSRDTFVPFLRGHINVSVEQTKFKPVNLGVLLRAHFLGEYPETTEAQLQEARDRKAGNR